MGILGGYGGSCKISIQMCILGREVIVGFLAYFKAFKIGQKCGIIIVQASLLNVSSETLSEILLFITCVPGGPAFRLAAYKAFFVARFAVIPTVAAAKVAFGSTTAIIAASFVVAIITAVSPICVISVIIGVVCNISRSGALGVAALVDSYSISQIRSYALES
jgi:hypothetical protein